MIAVRETQTWMWTLHGRWKRFSTAVCKRYVNLMSTELTHWRKDTNHMSFTFEERTSVLSLHSCLYHKKVDETWWFVEYQHTTLRLYLNYMGVICQKQRVYVNHVHTLREQTSFHLLFAKCMKETADSASFSTKTYVWFVFPVTWCLSRCGYHLYRLLFLHAFE
jgi:hypothetical protein